MNASKVFSRIDWVRIVGTSPDGVITEQLSGVKAFGFKFYTTNRFRHWKSLDGDYTILNFLQTESGSTMRNCAGAWSIADRSSPGAPLCYLHYSLAFDALDRFPGQEAVMRDFGQADVLRVLGELGAAAKKAGATTAPPSP